MGLGLRSRRWLWQRRFRSRVTLIVARSTCDPLVPPGCLAPYVLHVLSVHLVPVRIRRTADRAELQDHLRRNLDQVPIFVEEALRLESPFRYMMRTVPANTSLGGVEIRAGATVLLLWAAGNRDEQEFEHPEVLDLTRRAPRRHVAFGRGIHHCVGAPLARIEARNVLSVLLDRTSSISLDPEHPPHWVDSLLVRRHQDLAVRLYAR
jgi:cytochrome P450